MATAKKKTVKKSPTLQITQLLAVQGDWVSVWFNIDKHGEFSASSVVTERLICWALTSEGIIGAAPASPSDEASGIYLPEFVDENFRGYCLEEKLQEFLQEWDASAEVDEDEDEDEDEDDEDEDEDG